MKKNTLYFSDSQEDLTMASALLKQGGTVIFPTETVYGLGADALNPKAVEQIFLAKGRPSDNPLIVHIANREQLSGLVAEIPEKALILMDAFWPGPLTLIFKKSSSVPKTVTGGLDTVAIRMPKQPIAHKLLDIAQIPIAAPSANLSGKPSPTEFIHVKDDMDGRVDAIIDGGNCQVGVESTVLDISGETPVLYRPGGITKEEIEAHIGTIQVVTKAKEGETPKSPGLKYKHYAPDAEIQILKGSFDQVKNYAETMAKQYKTAILTFDEFPSFSGSVMMYSLGSKDKPEDAANRLFSALRFLDGENIEYILAPEIPDSGVWSAVRNRLYRAAGETIIDLNKMSILFVCTGNTCRSPMAEGLMKMMTQNENCTVSSAGLYADGAPASKEAILTMQGFGIDISQHTSRQLTPEMIEEATLILTMTNAHRDMLLSITPQYKNKIRTLADWADASEDVADPFGGDIQLYQQTADQILELLKKGWRKHQ